MEFFTMGMFILDDIVYPDKTKLEGVIGGAGIYAAQSGGLFLEPSARKQSVGMIIDSGSDFTPKLRDTIDSWKLNIIWRHSNDRLTTRGLNTYLDNDARGFEYLSPKIQIEAKDILESPEIASSKSLHLICSPTRCLEIAQALKEENPKQLLVWEPVPFNCTPSDFEGMRRVLDLVDVISPNAKEAASFLGKPEPQTKEEIEQVSDAYSEYKGILVIRCGAMGSLVVQNSVKTWYNAYHLSPDQVVDPTGGGNSFLGGLCIGLAKDPRNIQTAIIYATVAAGLQIEQVGLARYNSAEDTWNGDKIAQRIQNYVDREGLVTRPVIN